MASYIFCLKDNLITDKNRYSKLSEDDFQSEKEDIESNFFGEKPKLKFPTKNSDRWQDINLKISTHLTQNFVDSDTPEKTMIKLLNDVYSICKDFLEPKKNFTLIHPRDKMIAKVDNSKLHKNYTGK